MGSDFIDKFIYRFRPPVVKPPVVKDDIVADPQKDVLQELENQEIFLATIKENNDPMDGLLDVFWEGDSILWKNFIKHYCLCLMDSLIKINIFGNTRLFQCKDIMVFLTPEDLETDQYKNLYDIYINELFQDKNTEILLNIFTSKHKLHKVELSMLLLIFNFSFLRILNKVTKDRLGFEVMQNIEKYTKEYINLSKFDPEKAFSSLEKAVLSTKQDLLHFLSDFLSGMPEEVSLKARYNTNMIHKNSIVWSNFATITNSFPKNYLDIVIEQIYPPYYVSCFSRCNNNCSMWGHYAKGHTGICLIFQPKTEGKNEYIETENGEKLFLMPIKYDDKPPELNYFENIAYLPRPKYSKYWLTDGDNRSNTSKFNRDEYWNRYREKISHKFKDWEYEQETRAIMEGLFPSDYLGHKERKVKYKFEYLRGIIFGIKTDEEMKLNIIKIIEQKMKKYGRKDFEFHQAQYFSFERKLAIRKLGPMCNS